MSGSNFLGVEDDEPIVVSDNETEPHMHDERFIENDDLTKFDSQLNSSTSNKAEETLQRSRQGSPRKKRGLRKNQVLNTGDTGDTTTTVPSGSSEDIDDESSVALVPIYQKPSLQTNHNIQSSFTQARNDGYQIVNPNTTIIQQQQQYPNINSNTNSNPIPISQNIINPNINQNINSNLNQQQIQHIQQMQQMQQIQQIQQMQHQSQQQIIGGYRVTPNGGGSNNGSSLHLQRQLSQGETETNGNNNTNSLIDECKNYLQNRNVQIAVGVGFAVAIGYIIYRRWKNDDDDVNGTNTGIQNSNEWGNVFWDGADNLGRTFRRRRRPLSAYHEFK